LIIKSHIRAGYRAAADYLKDQGQNEYTRLVEISDHDASNLDEAFQNMWAVASATKAKKPLHHISINPFKDERLTNEQVLKIVKRCEEKYGYEHGEHQRVIVEHIKDGRQHFHVMWNRTNLKTGRPVWPGHHWKKSKQAAREMEVELGLKRPMPRRYLKAGSGIKALGRIRSLYRLTGFAILRPKALIIKINSAIAAAKRMARIARKQEQQNKPPVLSPIRSERKGWPPAAIADWESWGHKNPPRFFRKWPELSF
jgi:hypothetical protein